METFLLESNSNDDLRWWAFCSLSFCLRLLLVMSNIRYSLIDLKAACVIALHMRDRQPIMDATRLNTFNRLSRKPKFERIGCNS